MAESVSVPEIDLPLVASGKVREIYQLDAERLMIVTSDRISAYDVVMEERIANKGRALGAMTSFWFDQLVDVAPNHRASFEARELPDALSHPYFGGRTEIVQKASMLPLECIVRGHLTGSAWKEYRERGTVHKMAAPDCMLQSEEFPEPMFTPSTKALEGHDENISFDDAVYLVGGETAELAREISLAAFKKIRARAEESGLIVADTKFELGFIDGVLVICDEVGTSDSSRFWPKDLVEPGQAPPSFDKQPLRDYLDSLDWDKVPPAPPLPPEIVNTTSHLYTEAYERITGLRLADWPGIHVQLGSLAVNVTENK